MDTVPKFHAKAPQRTLSEGLAKRPFEAARAGFEPITLRTKGVDSTKASPRLTSATMSHNKHDFNTQCNEIVGPCISCTNRPP